MTCSKQVVFPDPDQNVCFVWEFLLKFQASLCHSSCLCHVSRHWSCSIDCFAWSKLWTNSEAVNMSWDLLNLLNSCFSRFFVPHWFSTNTEKALGEESDCHFLVISCKRDISGQTCLKCTTCLAMSQRHLWHLLGHQ